MQRAMPCATRAPTAPIRRARSSSRDRGRGRDVSADGGFDIGVDVVPPVVLVPPDKQKHDKKHNQKTVRDNRGDRPGRFRDDSRQAAFQIRRDAGLVDYEYDVSLQPGEQPLGQTTTCLLYSRAASTIV